MDALLPGKKRFTQKNADVRIIRRWVASELNWKAKVVCGACNNTWMNDIENHHAKPALADLITGKLEISIDTKRANSIALYCFKTAMVFDLISSHHAPFFRKEERYAFKDSLAIPANVKMWMATFAPVGRGEVHTGYLSGTTSPTNYFQMYVCTFGVEHFVFQLLASRTTRKFAPMPGFEDIAVPFWPKFNGRVWPQRYALRTTQEFDTFSLRWKSILFLG